MPAGKYEDADAIAIAFAYLSSHPDILAPVPTGFGSAAAVSGVFEEPWPHLIVAPDDAGTPRDLRWQSQQGMSLTVVGDPAGVYGHIVCRRLLMRALRVVKELDEQPTPSTSAVISRVSGTGAITQVVLSTGAVQWRSVVLFDIHPPFEA